MDEIGEKLVLQEYGCLIDSIKVELFSLAGLTKQIAPPRRAPSRTNNSSYS